MNKERMTNQALKQFLLEINLLKTMDHPNILKMFEVFHDSKRFMIITEYCEGSELFDELSKRERFTEGDCARIMKQIFSALAYCHQNNIAHRDIKPENFIINESGLVKLIDFGCSTLYQPGTKLKLTQGTPYYIAPEVVKGSYTN